MLQIRNLSVQYMNRIRQPLWGFLLSPFAYMNLKRDVVIQSGEESHIEAGVVRYVGPLGDVEEVPDDGMGEVSRIKVNVYHINPLDSKGRNFIREFEISFAAALILLDNSMAAWEPYMENTAIRRSLLYDVPGGKDDFQKTVREIWSNYQTHRHSEKLKDALDLYLEIRRIENSHAEKSFGSSNYPLRELIETRGSFQWLLKGPPEAAPIRRLARGVKTFFTGNEDGLGLITHHTTHIFGKAFGLSANVFQARQGYLKNMAPGDFRRLSGSLKSLDVLVEKSRSRLTDKFIPGHFGHLAIWVGTEAEMKEAEVWDRLPALYEFARTNYGYEGPSFQEAVREGKGVVEALAGGVQFNTLRHFLDIDDLAVLRLRECPVAGAEFEYCLTPAKKRTYLLALFSQVGKAYDFNFDVNTSSELVCTEVAYWTFVDFDFKTDRALGKQYLTPDHIARMGDEPGDSFFPAAFYINGNRIEGKQETLQAQLHRLLVGTAPPRK